MIRGIIIGIAIIVGAFAIFISAHTIIGWVIKKLKKPDKVQAVMASADTCVTVGELITELERFPKGTIILVNDGTCEPNIRIGRVAITSEDGYHFIRSSENHDAQAAFIQKHVHQEVRDAITL